MGMDVFGSKPTSEVGAYFRRNVWGWRPLAELICEMAPEIASECKYWQSNDGDGLSAASAVRLADALQRALDDGRVERWIKMRDAAVRLMPNEACHICAAAGVRGDDIGLRMGQDKRVCEATTSVNHNTITHPRAGQIGWCNGCDGRGWSPPTASSYGTDAESVSDFIAFARASGGFKIC